MSTDSSVFNKKSRIGNVLKTSSMGMISTVSTSLMAFVYRTFFIYILSSSYLGIEGLFSNILKMLSLAELGISTAITYRFYEPISRNDVKKVAQILNFFKVIYIVIASVILLGGLSILPFLENLIKDTSEIPSDINIYYVYILYLIGQVSTYLYSYKLTILTADQKQYIVSLFNLIVKAISYIAQILILIIWKNFTLTLLLNIIITLFSNIIMSRIVTKQYKELFVEKELLPKKERFQIYKDTFATLCHKVGNIVLNGTDNIVISSFVGLTAAGIYSNYHMIVYSIITIMQQVTGNFTASLGNAAVEKSKDGQFQDYKKLLFATMWLSSYISVCFYVLIDRFMLIWTHKAEMVLNEATIIAISILLYTDIIRYINHSYINGNGLFVKDKLRPLIESVLNLIISIIAVQKLGLIGVFIGTIISRLLTTFWREPFILFKYGFEKPTNYYWKTLIQFFSYSFIMAFLLKFCLNNIFASINIGTWIIEGIICTIIFNSILILLFRNSDNYKFFKQKLLSFIKR